MLSVECPVDTSLTCHSLAGRLHGQGPSQAPRNVVFCGLTAVSVAHLSFIDAHYGLVWGLAEAELVEDFSHLKYKFVWFNNLTIGKRARGI